MTAVLLVERAGGLDAPVDRETGEAGLAQTLERLARRLEQAPGQVVLAPDDLRLPRAAVEEVLHPPPGTALVTSPAGSGPPVHVRSGRVQSVGSSWHRVSHPNAVSTGMLVVADADRVAAARAARAMAAALSGSAGAPAGRRLPAAHGALEHLAVALVRSGVPVRALDLGAWPWGRPESPEEAARLDAQLAGLDEERLQVERALRPSDGFYSTFVVRRLSNRLTPLAARAGLTPNVVTLLSFAVGLVAAGCFCAGTRGWTVLGALLLQLSLVVDCVDGELARLTRRFTALGAWLDATTDRVKEYAAYGGLAVGSARSGRDVWLLAAALLVVQTVRHSFDYDFALVQVEREARPPVLRLDQADDGRGGTSATGWSSRRAVSLSERSSQVSAVRWAKRVVHMPIGERWLVLSLGAALAGPRAALLCLLLLVLLALAYTAAGRTLRALSWSAPPRPGDVEQALGRQYDLGPPATVLSSWRRPGPGRAAAVLPLLLGAAGAAAVGAGLLGVEPGRRAAALAAVALALALVAGALRSPVPGRFAWAVPPALRLAELGLVVRLAETLGSAPAATYALLFVVAFHHYDVLYRVLHGAAVPDWLRLAGLGLDGRLLLLSAVAALAPGRVDAAVVGLAGWCAVVFGLLGTASHLREGLVRPPAPPRA